MCGRSSCGSFWTRSVLARSGVTQIGNAKPFGLERAGMTSFLAASSCLESLRDGGLLGGLAPHCDVVQELLNALEASGHFSPLISPSAPISALKFNSK